jgi:hypothetical protein
LLGAGADGFEFGVEFIGVGEPLPPHPAASNSAKLRPALRTFGKAHLCASHNKDAVGICAVAPSIHVMHLRMC